MSAIAGFVPGATVPAAGGAVRSQPAPITSRAVEATEWDRIISGFDGVCQEQLYAFASARWPNVTLEPRLFELHGRIVGGALVMVQNLPLGFAQLAICKWGPMLADAVGKDAMAQYAGMAEALVAEYAERRGMLLSVLPHASTEAINSEYRILRERGFSRGFPLPQPARYLVNLTVDEATQRKSLQQTWRRQLAKSEKAGLDFEHGTPDRLGEFKALYGAMTGRKQFQDFSAFDSVDGLMALDQPLRPELFFVRHEGEVVAGAMIFKAGDRAAYLYGATNDKALPLRAGYFLHWHIIGWLKASSRARWYDLGGTDGFSGLHQFKRGMVGEAGVVHQVPPTANYAANARARLFGNGAFAAREYANRLKRRISLVRGSGAKPDQLPPELDEQFK